MSDKRIYSFFGYHTFNSFLRSNYQWIFPSIQEGNTEIETGAHKLFRDQVDLFKKVCVNVAGGCPCNKAKRVTHAQTMYRETVEMFSKCHDVHEESFRLLNSPEEIHFHNERIPSERTIGEPFLIVKSP